MKINDDRIWIRFNLWGLPRSKVTTNHPKISTSVEALQVDIYVNEEYLLLQSLLYYCDTVSRDSLVAKGPKKLSRLPSFWKIMKINGPTGVRREADRHDIIVGGYVETIAATWHNFIVFSLGVIYSMTGWPNNKWHNVHAVIKRMEWMKHHLAMTGRKYRPRNGVATFAGAQVYCVVRFLLRIPWRLRPAENLWAGSVKCRENEYFVDCVRKERIENTCVGRDPSQGGDSRLELRRRDEYWVIGERLIPR